MEPSFHTAPYTYTSPPLRHTSLDKYAHSHGNLTPRHRIRYVPTFLLAKIWYAAQIFPAPSLTIQNLTAAVTCFLWRETILRVPVAVLRARKTEGGWDLIDVAAKYRTLFFCRLHTPATRRGKATAAWFRQWNLSGPVPNPPKAAAKSNGICTRLCNGHGLYLIPQARWISYPLSWKHICHPIQRRPPSPMPGLSEWRQYIQIWIGS
jgi:hypothetical protein